VGPYAFELSIDGTFPVEELARLSVRDPSGECRLSTLAWPEQSSNGIEL
jgi:hypothetical protein